MVRSLAGLTGSLNPKERSRPELLSELWIKLRLRWLSGNGNRVKAAMTSLWDTE